ncbi:MAG: pyroglutamyl-peptidase I family protein [Promethearchaeota archaeon]
MAARVLFTGFEPFGSHEINLSGVLAKRLDGTSVVGHEVTGRVIPLRFSEIGTTIEDLVESVDPVLVVCTGIFWAPFISLETRARNWVDTKSSPYNCGTIVKGAPLVPDGPAEYASSLPVGAIFEALKSNEFPVSISRDAGAFGCNQLFYLLMAHLESRERDTIGGFVHLPAALLSIEELEAASRALIATAVESCGAA